MKRLVLLRHGETIWHAGNRYAGSSDIPLNEHGRLQAERLARWARTAPRDAIWSSPLQRARHTAQPAAEACGLSLQIDDRLRELDFGDGEGLTDAEMQAAFPDQRRAFLADPVLHHLPGGENPQGAVTRGMASLHEIADGLPIDGCALLVAHNTLIRLLLCACLDIPLSRYRTVFPQLSNSLRTELGVHANGFALLAFNAPLLLPNLPNEVSINA